MNVSFPLVLHIARSPITSPLEGVSELLDGDQFALRFVEAVAVEQNDKRTDRPLDLTDTDSDNIDSPPPDLDAQLTAALQTLKPESLTTLKMERRGFDLTDLNPTEKRDFSKEITPQLKTVQNQSPVSDIQKNAVPFLQDNGAPVSLSILPESVPILNKITDIEQSSPTIKSAPIFVDADVNDNMIRTAELKILATQDGSGSFERPLSQTVPGPSQASQITAIATPTSQALVPITAPSGKTQTMPMPVLSVEIADQWVTKLGQDISSLSNAKSTLSFQLIPNHLGKLHVAIATDAAGEIVRVETDNESTRALIMASQGRLEQDIRQSGMKLGRLEVTMQDQFGSQLEQQGSRPRGSQTQLEKERDGQVRQLVDQISASQKRIVANLSHNGARYA